MYPVAEPILFDGIEQRLLFPAGPSSLRLGTPQSEAAAVHLLIAVPSAVIPDLRSGREALGAQLDVGTVGAAQPQVRHVRQAVHAVLLTQVRHLGAGLLLALPRARAASLSLPVRVRAFGSRADVCVWRMRITATSCTRLARVS